MAIGRVISLDSGVYKILGENNFIFYFFRI